MVIDVLGLPALYQDRIDIGLTDPEPRSQRGWITEVERLSSLMSFCSVGPSTITITSTYLLMSGSPLDYVLGPELTHGVVFQPNFIVFTL